MKTTYYFDHIRNHPEVTIEHAIYVAEHYEREKIQPDGRIRRWAYVSELGRYVRVVLLPDGETLHNAFIDRGYKP